MADATVTTNTFNIVKLPEEGKLFYTSAYSANWSTVGNVVAAVAGSTHYITKIQFTIATNTSVTIGSGSGADVVTTFHFGPMDVDVSSGMFLWEAPDGFGLQLTASTELALETADAAPVWIYVEGKTCKN